MKIFFRNLIYYYTACDMSYKEKFYIDGKINKFLRITNAVNKSRTLDESTTGNIIRVYNTKARPVLTYGIKV